VANQSAGGAGLGLAMGDLGRRQSKGTTCWAEDKARAWRASGVVDPIADQGDQIRQGAHEAADQATRGMRIQ
jgi:hypothetical protein